MLTYAGITVGAISLLLVGRYFFKKVAPLLPHQVIEYFLQVNDIRKRKLIELKQIIIEERLKSKAIVELHTDDEILIPATKGDTQVTFLFSYMENLNKKYTGQTKTHPFLPPIEPGIFITDLSPTHRLLFNKFSLVKNHVLVVTSSFQEQTDPLNLNDFASGYKVLLALKGFCFYNSGPNS